MQVFFHVLGAMSKHILDTSIQQIPLLNSLFLGVIEHVFRYQLDDLTLILGHWLENEYETKFLIIVLSREKSWLPLEFIFDRMEGVSSYTDEVEHI